MKSKSLATFLIVVLISLCSNCASDDETDQLPPECYRCTYGTIASAICDQGLIYEACVITPHQSSLQVILEITEICDGQIIRTSEDIGFMEDFVAIHQNDGASCEQF